jgi:Delta3,5-Delta2,4-dienoyl-CoA isomerase
MIHQEVDLGMASDIGTLARFPKIVGNESATRELALTGRFFDAAEASRLGFVSKTVKGGRDEVIGMSRSSKTNVNS